MEPGSILVERELPIDGALVGPCLLRLRRDTAGPSCTWTLGGHGAAELDVHFRRAGDPDGGTGAWSAGGRLWEPDRLAVATVVVELWPSTDRCVLRILLGTPATAARVARARAPRHPRRRPRDRARRGVALAREPSRPRADRGLNLHRFPGLHPPDARPCRGGNTPARR
ncbi:MAG: hypothetical protein KatS3mg009_2770 [Acidimicrobiia bacterium]|nr:MAG: hypothetical protein KatS3mg009_2770 [Acidimicrobiia bacterium]